MACGVGRSAGPELNHEAHEEHEGLTRPPIIGTGALAREDSVPALAGIAPFVSFVSFVVKTLRGARYAAGGRQAITPSVRARTSGGARHIATAS